MDSVLENLELKESLFQDLDSLRSKETLLATNTSVIHVFHDSKYLTRRAKYMYGLQTCQ